MFLRKLAEKCEEARFRVTNCPWLKGTIKFSTLSGVTVKLDTPNRPDDDKEEISGNYTGRINLSGKTEVTRLRKKKETKRK